jgi:hypothetical protein
MRASVARHSISKTPRGKLDERRSLAGASRGVAALVALLSLILLAFARPAAAQLSGRDDDRDGLDDGLEQSLAARFFPVIHYDNGLNCLSPHPQAGPPYGAELKPVAFAASYPTAYWSTGGGDAFWANADYIAIRYILLYDEDCGLNGSGHPGDNESFVVFIKYNYSVNDWAFSSIIVDTHRGTGVCEHTVAASEVDAYSHPEIWIGTRKHSNYTDRNRTDSCVGDDFASDPGQVTEYRLAGSETLTSHFLFNIGEAGRPLVTDLGTVQSRWSGKNPWVDQFYSAGYIGSDTALGGYDLSLSPPPAPAAGWFLDGGVCAGAGLPGLQLSGASDEFDAAGGTHSVTLTADTTCGWRVSTDSNWISVSVSNPGYQWAPSDGLAGAGSASISYTVQPSSGSARTGTIFIGSKPFVVTQSTTVNVVVHVQDNGGQPLGGATVDWQPAGVLTTDGNGNTTAVLLRGWYTLVVSDGGYVTQSNPVYVENSETITISLSPNSPPPPFNYLGTSYLYQGQAMQPNDALSSDDGWYTLAFQYDGNLVLYDGNFSPVWWTGTDNSGAVLAIMQDDGNFVLYDSGYTPLFWTGTDGNGGAFLRVQDDSNVVVYSDSWIPLWAWFGM